MNAHLKLAFHALLLAVLVVSVNGCPRVEPVRLLVNQGDYGEQGGYSELHHSDFFGGTQQLGDDFTLAEGLSEITHARWCGAYRDDTPVEDDFTIRIHRDNGFGMPQAWAAYEFHAGAVDRVATDEALAPASWDLDLYRYEYQLEDPLDLDPGDTYFLVILNDTGKWMWSNCDAVAQGNNFGVSRTLTFGLWGSHGIDMRFQIWGR